MSDTPFTLEIPEDLLKRAQANDIDLRQTLIEALERKVLENQSVSQNQPHEPMPTQAEIEAAIKMSQQRLAVPNASRRQLGLHQGQFWMSDDFDDELPDEFWFGEDA